MNLIRLTGCRPEPLASYLKALAVLRLVAEQKDAQAKTWWDDGCFCLKSVLDAEALLRFFLDEYRPTPLVAPWNGGSGFYEGDNTEGRDAILDAPSPRFAAYRTAISSALSWPELPPRQLPLGRLIAEVEETAGRAKGQAGKQFLSLVADVREALASVQPALGTDDPLALSVEQLQERLPTAVRKTLVQRARKLRTRCNKDFREAHKGQVLRACRNRLDDSVVAWMDAAVTVGSNDELGFPPLLGTAANEGRLDYTNAFMEKIASLLIRQPADGSTSGLLRNALFAEPTDGLRIASVGQYDPGRAGGYNQGAEIETKDFPTNPWDFVLTLEGTLLWASGVSRRQATSGSISLASPFTVRARAVGYSSSASSDQEAARSEIWAPLWGRPSGYPEVRALFSEGRADVGRRRAADGIEFAEAASSLGTDRGITHFVRYSLLKRRGDSYIALPVGRFQVQAKSESDLVRQLEPLLDRVDAFLRRFPSDPPARFLLARRAIDEALYALLLHGGTSRFKGLVAAVGRLEQLFAQRDTVAKPSLPRPLSGLDPAWVAAADDGTLEVRLAGALASIAPTGDVGSIRANLALIDPARPWQWATGQGQRAWSGASLSARMASALARRMMDATRLNCKSNPLHARLALCPEDAAGFIEGDIDESLVEDLLFGFCWVDWHEYEAVRRLRSALHAWRRPVSSRIVPASWALLKLLFLPGPIRTAEGAEISVRAEPSVLPLLEAGRVGEACRVAQRRLFAAGLAPARPEFPQFENGLRLAAALLLPVYPVAPLLKKALVQSQSASLTR